MHVWRQRNTSASDVLEKFGVFRLLPVQQVLEVVNEGSLSQDASLSQNCTQKKKVIDRETLSAIGIFFL